VQFYADTNDFTGLPDPTLNNTIAPATAGTTDGDQYVALQQRQSIEPLFAKYNVDVSPPLHMLNLTRMLKMLHVLNFKWSAS